jgi:histidinol-phosphate aminotransferase
MLYLANPDNPTGSFVTAQELEDFVRAVPPDCMLLLDEAYVEYARLTGCDSGLPWLQEFPNLVLVRTFSKAYGLAGVRVGYAVSHPEVADALNRIRPAFNVSNVAQAGPPRPYSDPRSEGGAPRGRRTRGVTAALRAMSPVAPSAGNFLLVEVARPRRLTSNSCAAEIVRPAGYGRRGFACVGRPPEQNDRLLQLFGCCCAGMNVPGCRSFHTTPVTRVVDR